MNTQKLSTLDFGVGWVSHQNGSGPILMQKDRAGLNLLTQFKRVKKRPTNSVRHWVIWIHVVIVCDDPSNP